MDLITPERVVERFEKLHREGRLRFLSRKWKPYAAAARATTSANTFDLHNITPLNSVARAEEFIATIPTYPSRRFSGRGIVICAGGVNYFAQAWVCIQMLRRHGCELPIQIWHLGRTELDEKMEALVRPLGVECVNARKVMNRHPMRNPLGWELKCYSILRSPFAEVISLDADNVPLIDPTELFNTPEYLRTGAIFWPDYGRLKRHRAIWKLCGIPFRDEPEFESGQMVVDKSRCWKSINLAWWYNDHSEFFYRHIHGDKETFHLAWRKIGQEYSMPPFPVRSLSGTMCQHDFEGRLIFQHRNSHKFQFFGGNVRVPGFLLEDECLDYLEQLRAKWDGRIRGKREATRTETGFSFRKHTVDRHVFESVAHGNEYALPPVLNPEDVVLDVGAHIGSFSWAAHERGSRRIHSFEPHPENFEMARKNLGGTPGVTLRRAAILHCNTAVIPGDFPADGPLQNTGGGIVNVDRAGCTPAFALDEVILKLEKVTLIKLDCEGSEWPILIHSQLLDRVTALCGEYHARPSHALCPEIGRELDREFLESILRRHFRHVRCVADRKDAAVGKFWASNVKSFFGRGTRLDSSKTARIRAAAVRSASSAGGGP